MREEVRTGRRESVERWRRKRHARERPDSRLGGQGMRGAHGEDPGLTATLDSAGVPSRRA